MSDFYQWVIPNEDGVRSQKEASRGFFDMLAEVITTKGGKGSGHWGHEGRPGQRGGSKPGDQPDEKLSYTLSDPDDRRVANELYRRIYADPGTGGGGFTYRPYVGAPDKGIVVALPQNELIIKEKELKKSDLWNYVRGVREFLESNPDAFVGAWYDKDNGVVVFDTSRIFNTVEEAREVGQRWKQRAGFDLATFETIWFWADEGRIAASAEGG